MAQTTYIPQAPQGYSYHTPLIDDWESKYNYPFWVLILLANFLALAPLAFGILFLWFPYQFYKMLSAAYAVYPELTLSLPILIELGILIIGGSMFLHEWLHGIALAILGYKPRYAFHKYYLLANIEVGSFLTRPHYLIMSLTPIVVMTVVGALLLPFFPPAIGNIVLVAMLLNLAASIGDLMVAMQVYKAPKDALFADDHGIQVFLPIASD